MAGSPGFRPLRSLTLLACLAAAEAGPVANPFGRKYPPHVYQTARLEGKRPAIDGRLDDEAWKQGVWPGDYTQQLPVEGASGLGGQVLN